MGAKLQLKIDEGVTLLISGILHNITTLSITNSNYKIITIYIVNGRPVLNYLIVDFQGTELQSNVRWFDKRQREPRILLVCILCCISGYQTYSRLSEMGGHVKTDPTPNNKSSQTDKLYEH